MKIVEVSRGLHRIVFMLILLISASFTAKSSNDSVIVAYPCYKTLHHGVGVDIRPGGVIHSNNFLRGSNYESKTIDYSLSAHIKYRFSFDKYTKFGKLYPGVYQGVGIAMNTYFETSMLGNPTAIYLFQGAPICKLSPRLSLGYEWNFGVALGWKKYDESSNPANSSIGSMATAYINVGLMFNYNITPEWIISAGVEASHFSNGNTAWPNSGLNTVSARIGITYLFDNKMPEAVNEGDVLRYGFKPHWSYDLMAYAAPCKKIINLGEEPQLLNGSFLAAGLNFAPMYNFSKYFNAGPSLDIQYNESAGLHDYWVKGTYQNDVKFYRPPFHKQLAIGLSARAEFVMPIFTINAGIGRNFVGPTELRRFYQTLTLKTFITRNIFLNIGYQLREFKDPDNLMLGVGYRFHSQR